MNTPKHSIIVPAYNTGEAIRRCIDSIVAQTYDNWELIIVDDGSRDATPAIIDEYATKDKRIHTVHISNGGVSNARNVGIEHAKGEYVMFVDSDDWIEPDYLQQVERYMDDDADMYIIGSTQDYINMERHVCYSSIKGSPIHRVVSSETLYKELGYLLQTINMESCWSKSFRLDFVNIHHIRFHKEMIVFEDYCFVLECLLNKSSISLIPFIGYHYITDLTYNPVVRRGYRDLYPSVGCLFEMFERIDKTLMPNGYSHEQLMRIMADKVNVVLSQSFYAKNYAEQTKPFRQIHADPVLNRYIKEVLKYSGGRRRLQYRLMSFHLYIISYLSYRYL